MEERIVERLERSLKMMEDDYAQTLAASRDQNSECKSNKIINQEIDCEAENSGYSPLPLDDDDEAFEEIKSENLEPDINESSGVKKLTDQRKLTTLEVDQITTAMRSLDLPTPPWAEKLDDKTLLAQVEELITSHGKSD